MEEAETSLGELERALAAARAANELPGLYARHPRVIAADAAGETLHPLIVYLDGVGYTKRDNALGVWAYFALSEKRHLLYVWVPRLVLDIPFDGQSRMECRSLPGGYIPIYSR